VSAPSRIRAVLFDLGGTLVDERDYAGWSELARGIYLDLLPERFAHAFPEVEAEEDLAPSGLDREAAWVEFWRKVLSRASGSEIASSTAARFVAARSACREPPMALYSDVRRCLDLLRGQRRSLGVVSNSRSEAAVRHILDRVGILPYFEAVVSSGTEGVAKPHPEIFRRALARMRVPPREALYVGNLLRTDALGARSAGLHAAWLHRDGMGVGGDDPPEITSLLEVPLVVAQLEAPAGPGSPAHR